MDIRHHVKELLYLHDCVIIPDFGGFVTAYAPAEVHKFRNLVYPPSKSIMFNKRLQANDGVLINHLALHGKIGYSEAEEKVKQFAAWCNRQLENKGVVIFPEVGKLYINSNNVLVFLPELRKNYLLDTFGLKPIAFQPQLEVVSNRTNERKEKISEPMDEAEYSERLRVRRRNAKKMLAAAAVLAALLFIVPQLFMQNILPEKIRIEQLNLMDLFQRHEEVSIASEPEKEQKAEIIQDSQELKQEINSIGEVEGSMPAEADSTHTELTEATIPVVSETNEDAAEKDNYYIILGSYEYISDAIRMKKQLDAQFGKTLEVFSSGDGNYLIGLFAGSRASAEASLAEFETGELKPEVLQRESPL